MSECFYCDESELMPVPKKRLARLFAFLLNTRYSMVVLMRLSQYNVAKGGKFRSLMSTILCRCNQVFNQFTHAPSPYVAPGVIFHHSGVTITTGTIIEEGVHIYGNVTFGSKNGLSPRICRNAKCATHSVIIGGVTVGENSIVAPGAVVLKSVPPGKIVAGVPAQIIGDVTEENYRF